MKQLQIRILVIEKCTELAKKCNVQKKAFDLVDIVMGWKTVYSLFSQEKYAYYKNHYVPTSNAVLLHKEYLKGGT